jgi:hypothetical protein
MLIRSQDKRNLVDMTGITIKIPCDGSGSSSEIRAFSNQTERQLEKQPGIYLGTYSTEEKALKVLDMIQKTYESTTSQLSINGFLITQCNKVFEMPADEDIDKEE